MAITINSVIPKTNVGRVLAVARAFNGKSKPMSREAIATKLNLRPGTGSANNRVIAAKKFGVIEPARSGGYVLTELGRRLAISEPSRKDIVAAIKNVGAFAKLIDQLDGDPGELTDAEITERLRAAGVREAELATATQVFIVSWSFRKPEANEESVSGGGSADAQSDAADETSRTIRAAPAASENPSPNTLRGTPFKEHEMIGWVLEQAPAIGETWDAERYEAWSELLRTTIRFLFPDTARDR